MKASIPHRFAVWPLVLLALSIAFTGCDRSGKPPAPNVLLISVDTLRADRLGSYGFPLARTGHIDRLAAEGVRFTDAITVAPITLPAHSSMMTGLIPPAHGVRDNGIFALNDDAQTIAERLQSAGYATHAFVSAEVLNRRYNLDQGFDSYDDAVWSAPEAAMFMIRYRPAHDTISRVLDWYEGRQQQPDERPFFTWVHLFDPHQPLQPPTGYRPFSPTLYDAEIAYVDDQLGRLFEALEKSGELDETLVVFTSDHGESLGEHGEATHGLFVYDATMHIPLIIRYPAAFPPGAVYEGPVRIHDIAPTVLAAAGLHFEQPVQGVDLTALVNSWWPAPKLEQYIESMLPRYSLGMAAPQGLRDGKSKWIRLPFPEFYELEDDPNESENRFRERRDDALSMDQALDQLLEEARTGLVDSDSAEMNAETMAVLQSLGYVQAGASDRRSMADVDPKDGLPLYNTLSQARHLAQDGDWEGAEEKLREVLSQLPTHISALNTMGKVLIEQDRLEAARKHYLASLEQWRDQDRVYLMLGQIALRQGRLDDARRHLDHALELSPDFVEAMLVHAQVALRARQAEVGLAWYRRAVESNPTHPRALVKLADLMFVRQEFSQAFDLYGQALAQQPDHYHAAHQAGLAALRLDRLDEASRLLQRAGSIEPDEWPPLYNLACVHASAGRSSAALDALESAIDKGLADPGLISQEPLLDTLAGNPRFERLIERISAVSTPSEEDAPN